MSSVTLTKIHFEAKLSYHENYFFINCLRNARVMDDIGGYGGVNDFPIKDDSKCLV